MAFSTVIWDLEDDPRGNVQHIARNDVTQEEVEEILSSPIGFEESRSSGRPIAFGEVGGRIIAVVYEEIDSDTAYPITAYEVED